MLHQQTANTCTVMCAGMCSFATSPMCTKHFKSIVHVETHMLSVVGHLVAKPSPSRSYAHGLSTHTNHAALVKDAMILFADGHCGTLERMCQFRTDCLQQALCERTYMCLQGHHSQCCLACILLCTFDNSQGGAHDTKLSIPLLAAVHDECP